MKTMTSLAVNSAGYSYLKTLPKDPTNASFFEISMSTNAATPNLLAMDVIFAIQELTGHLIIFNKMRLLSLMPPRSLVLTSRIRSVQDLNLQVPSA